jgi:pyruvate formate lyase activating enzyme
MQPFRVKDGMQDIPTPALHDLVKVTAQYLVGVLVAYQKEAIKSLRFAELDESVKGLVADINRHALAQGVLLYGWFGALLTGRIIPSGMPSGYNGHMATLAEKLDALTIKGWLCESEPQGVVRCFACGHRCRIQPDKRGVCQMRFNRDGELHVPWGYVAAANVDPIEKKPFMHFLPGSDALTFGMLGCNFHCDFCQNWVSSQALRDPASESNPVAIQPASPEDLVTYALQQGAQVIASSYNEPLITSEWAVDIFKPAKENGLKCVFVSNGYATPDVLQALQPYLDGFKVDLKCMTNAGYRSLGGGLQVVMDSIKLAHELGLWVEVVTLLIPGFNDLDEEVSRMASFIASVSVDIPWHISAFHPMYKRQDAPRTSADALLRAARIGQEAGLHFIYAGNLPGQVGEFEHTRCPNCHQLLIGRSGYNLTSYHITADGLCVYCKTPIAGIWSQDPPSISLIDW